MSDLAFVSTDALVEELSRRSEAGVVAYAFSDEGGGKFAARAWGSTFWRSGVLDVMSRAARHESMDLLLGGDDEGDDAC